MKTIPEIVKSIVQLEEELNLSNPHRASAIAVEMSVLLGNLVEPFSELEEQYLTLRGEKYVKNLEDGLKPTPASNSLEFDPELIKLKIRLEKFNGFIRSRERTINRIENHLREKTKMESRGI